MSFTIINNPNLSEFSKRSGFRPHEFKMLAGLYSRAASVKAINDMAVNVDFEEGVCEFSYYRNRNTPAYVSFIVRHVGPNTNMYELWTPDRGRIFKSGLFAYAFEKLEGEIEQIMPGAL